MKLRGMPGVGELHPHQWANDWITVDGPNFQSKVVSPERVQLDRPEEFARFREDELQHARGEIHSGSFWIEWHLNTDGTFDRNRF